MKQIIAIFFLSAGLVFGASPSFNGGQWVSGAFAGPAVSGTVTGNVTRSGTTAGGVTASGTLSGATVNSGTVSGGTLDIKTLKISGTDASTLYVGANSGTAANLTVTGSLSVPSQLFTGVTFASGYTAGGELMLTSSPDGVNFNIVAGPGVYTDPNGYTVRDPRMIAKNGRYYVAYTVNAFSGTSYKFIRIAVSDNLRDWAKYVDVDFSALANSDRVWGPKFLTDTDGTVRMYAAAGSGTSPTNFQMVEVAATNSALSTWGTPTVVTGSSFPTNMFDGSLLKISGTYHMVFRNISSGHIEHTMSTSPTSGFSTPTDTGLDTTGGTLEGCELTDMGTGTIRVYLDKYTRLGMYYSDTVDFVTWSTKTLITSPVVFANMGVVRATDVKVAIDFLRTAPVNFRQIFMYGNTIGMGYFPGTNTPISSSDYHYRTRDGVQNMIVTYDPRNATGGVQNTIFVFDSAGVGCATYLTRTTGAGLTYLRLDASTNNMTAYGGLQFNTLGFGLQFTATTSTATSGTIALSSWGEAPLYWSGTAATTVTAFTGGATGIKIPIYNTGTVALTFASTGVIHTQGSGTVTLNAGDTATASSYVISGTTFWNVK